MLLVNARGAAIEVCCFCALQPAILARFVGDDVSFAELFEQPLRQRIGRVRLIGCRKVSIQAPSRPLCAMPSKMN